MGQRQLTFDEQVLTLERELLALKQVKTTGGLLEASDFNFSATTSVSGKHYLITYDEGSESIFATFTASRGSVYYVFRTPNADGTQILDIYDAVAAGNATFTISSSRPVARVAEIVG